MFAIVVNQMDRGIALDFEEQEMIRAALLQVLREADGPRRDLETSYFRLYGVWARRPTWWELERQERKRKREERG